jgi:prepilin-type N-terminal cleavage/methylation domain-containing protein
MTRSIKKSIRKLIIADQIETSPRHRRGFTLIELLVVLGIIAFLASVLGVTISGFLTSAKEAQTLATLRKIDGLISERQQGLTQFFDSREFRKRVDDFHERLKDGNPTNGVAPLVEIARDFSVIIGKKELLRESLPQRFAEMIDAQDATGAIVAGGDGIPDQIQRDQAYGVVKWGIDPVDTILKPWVDTNGDGVANAGDSFHSRETESAELLYLALTRFEQYGIPPAGVDDFKTAEIADTDGDGLPEFVDAWGQPLRFYRWPSRLIKPFGFLGIDRAPGTISVDENLDTVVDDIGEVGWPGSEDTQILVEIRSFAGLYIGGLPRPPLMTGSPPRPILGDFDQLNVDGDDPIGVLLDETLRLAKLPFPILVRSVVHESTYHTFDTYHKPLVVSAGPDGSLGLYEPFFTEDLNGDGALSAGEDQNGNGYFDIGWLAQPIDEDVDFATYTSTGYPWDGVSGGELNGNGELDSALRPLAALDDMTNRNQRAGQ